MTFLAALLNAVLLLVATGGVMREFLRVLFSPGPVKGKTFVGVLVNGTFAMLFRKEENDLNVRAAFLHLVADAAVSLGVVFAGVTLLYTD